MSSFLPGTILAQFIVINSDKAGEWYTTLEQMRDKATATSFTGADSRKRALGKIVQQ